MLFAFLTAIATPYAQGKFNINNIPKLEPIAEEMTDDEFEQKTKLIKDNSTHDKDLAYTIGVPINWDKASVYSDVNLGGVVLEGQVLGVISRFFGPPSTTSERSFISVETSHLTYEIGAESWFLNYALTNGLSLERMTVHNQKELEAIYIEVRKDTTYIVRTRVMINGSKIILVKYYLPQNKFNDEKIMQAKSVESFKLLYVNNEPVEELKVFGFLSQSYFDYPPSWELISGSINSIDRMKVVLHRNTHADKLEGQIDVKLTNKLSVKSRAGAIKEFRNSFSIEGYEVGKVIDRPKIEYHTDMVFGTTQVYELLSETSILVDYELWVSVMESKDYYYVVSLITPAREEGFYTWARNVETYKLIVERMRLHNANKNLYEFIG